MGNYLLVYMFAMLGIAFVLPTVEKIGVGWFSTTSTAFWLRLHWRPAQLSDGEKGGETTWTRREELREMNRE